ncbi:hypothetical protein TNCT_335171, partial [Trichonephila clavata]
ASSAIKLKEIKNFQTVAPLSKNLNEI